MTPIQRFGESVADHVERWMPGPFVFAILLTLIAAGSAMLLEGAEPVAVAFAWHDGFWDLLQFAMQMVLILVTATVVAHHPRVNSGIQWLVSLPRNGRQAVVLVGLGSMLTGWLSWGLGLVFGAILAREMFGYAITMMLLLTPFLAIAPYLLPY